MLAKGDGHFDFAYFGYAQHIAVTWWGKKKPPHPVKDVGALSPAFSKLGSRENR